MDAPVLSCHGTAQDFREAKQAFLYKENFSVSPDPEFLITRSATVIAQTAPESATPALSFDRSARQIRENEQWIAGGVNSNFRLNIAPTPLVFERAEGPYLFDIDGNRLIDYYLGMGPMILGHSPHSVRQAVHDQVDRGILFAGQGALEVEAARLVCQMCRAPSVFASVRLDPRSCRRRSASPGRRPVGEPL
jgi:glutamate-1-semialdehyde 2,1-aminomutase